MSRSLDNPPTLLLTLISFYQINAPQVKFTMISVDFLDEQENHSGKVPLDFSMD